MKQRLTLAAVDLVVGLRPCVRVFITCQHPEEQWHNSEYTEWDRLDPSPEIRGQVIDRAVREHHENLAAKGHICDCTPPTLLLRP